LVIQLEFTGNRMGIGSYILHGIIYFVLRK
jgi:hypothetical protein